MANGYRTRTMNGVISGGGLLVGLLVLAAYFFIVSAIFMALWNGPVKNSLANGSVKKITYPTAMGLTLFCGLFLAGGAVILN